MMNAPCAPAQLNQHSLKSRLALVGLLFVLYSLAFFLYYPSIGQPIVSIIVLPLVGTSWLLGLKAGLVVWVLAFPFQAMLYRSLNVLTAHRVLDASVITGMMVTLIISAAVGHMREMGLALRREMAERKRTTEIQIEKERLQAALEKEKELVQLKNRFMNIISHEFRTPLAIIQSSTELVERYGGQLSPTRRAECLTTIKAQVHHINEMLNDMALVVENEIDYLEFKPTETDLEAFCKQLAADMALAKNHPIQFQAIGDLRHVYADTRLLHHILNNLLSNAVKYSAEGSPVHFTAQQQNDEIILTIQDYGIGIPLPDQERIFDTFYRASNVGNISGTGLGLRIVRDYLALHRGTIDMVSKPNGGSIFTVRLTNRQPQVA